MIALSERINVQSLVISEPKQRIGELPFDPERDITPEHREIWENRQLDKLATNEFIDNIYWRNFTSLLILFPNSREKLVTMPFEEMATTYKESISIGQLRIIYPDKMTESFIKNSGRKFEDYKRSLEERCGKFLNNVIVGDFNFVDEVFETFLLFPERHTELRAMEIIGETLSVLGKRFGYSRYFHSEIKLVSKLLKPHDTTVTDPEWEIMKSLLASDHVNSGWYMPNAARMKMLTAQEIKVTSKGLRLVMPGDGPMLKEEIPRPILRKF